MSAPTPKALDLLALAFPLQGMCNGYYVAEITRGLGACGYVIHDGLLHKFYQMQLMPVGPGIYTHNPHALDYLKNAYIGFSLNLANSGGLKGLELRATYPTLKADDLLTLRCLIHEAEQNWRDKHAQLEARSTDAPTGEGMG